MFGYDLKKLALLALSSGYFAEAGFSSTFSPTEASWTVQYGDTYKLVNFTKSNTNYLYVLTSTGQSRPVAGTNIPASWSGATFIDGIPLTDKVSLMSSTQVGYIEVSGVAFFNLHRITCSLDLVHCFLFTFL